MLTRHRTIVVASMVAAIAAGLWIGAGVLSASVTNERGNEGKVASSNHMTVRRYLATYWGRQWPVVESSIPDEQRPVLDTYIDTEQVTPWEQIEDSVRLHIRDGFREQRTAWIESYRDKDRDLVLTGAILGDEARVLSGAERSRLQEIVNEYAPILELLGAQSFELMEEIDNEIWDKRMYSKSPIFDPVVPASPDIHSDLHIVRFTKAEVWHVYYVIDSAEWPQLGAKLSEISALLEDRRRLAMATLK